MGAPNSSPRRIGAATVLASVVIVITVICIGLLIVAAVRGDAVLAENTGVGLFMLALIAVPAWVAYALGRRKGVERRIEGVEQSLDEIHDALGRIEQHMGAPPGSSVHQFPSQHGRR